MDRSSGGRAIERSSRALRHSLQEYAPLIGALAVATIAVLPALSVHGIVATRAGGDSPFLLQRTQQMATALAARHVPPRWMPDAAYGLGYPFWTFYSPLIYVVAGLLAMFGGGVVGAVKVATLLVYLVAGAGMYAFGLRLWERRSAAFLASAAYTLAPYHLVNVYVRGDALAENTAYALLPWVLLAMLLAARRRSTTSVAGLALAFGALLVSHNITAMLFAPVLVVYGLWVVIGPEGRGVGRAARGAAARRPPPGVPASEVARSGHWLAAPAVWTVRLLLVAERRLWLLRRFDRPWRLLAVGFGLCLGALLSAWFWGPALVERSAVQLDRNLTGYFHFANHFRGRDLVDWYPAFRFGAEAPGTCGPCRLGLAQVVLAIAGAMAGLRLPGKRLTTGFWSVVALVSVLMILPLSRPLWSMPVAGEILAFAQFPWRWLSIAALALATLTGAIGRLRYGWPFALVAAGILALAGLWRIDVAPLPVTTVERADIATFEVFSGNIGTTVRAEYLPAAVVPRPWSGPEAVHGTPGDPVALAGFVESAVRDRVEGATETWTVSVAPDAPAAVAFPALWFPGRVARIDDGPIMATEAVPGSGWVRVQVPPGTHSVTIALGRSTVRAAAEGISLMAWLLWLALVLADRRRRLWRWVGALALAFALSALLARWLPVGEAAGPLTMDFAQTPYPHYNPEGIRFASARLTSATIGGTQPVNAEEGVVVNLQWQDIQAEARVEAALVLPSAVNPELRAPDVRAATGQAMAEVSNLVLPVPRDAPSGTYFVRVRVLDGDRPVTPRDAAGRDLGDIYLGPVMVRGKDRFQDVPASPVGRMGPLTLMAVQAVQQSDRMEVRTYWESGERMALNYKTSVRLTTADSALVAQSDAEPLYGHYPATSWEARVQLRDHRWLDLPPGTSSGDDYMVSVVVYDEASGTEVGTGTVSGVRIDAVPLAPQP